MLGECLKELEESHDQHAVLGGYTGPPGQWAPSSFPHQPKGESALLIPSSPSPVLQPAVEAVFLVHATERESKPPVWDTRESQLAHIKDEPLPLSPPPLIPATPSSLDPFFS